MRRLLITAALILGAAVVFSVLTLPPAPSRRSLDGVAPDLLSRTVAGAYHIHTTRSDGAGDKASVAAAAARAGLRFAIFTDHGDGTLAPDPPAYVNGVLCIDGVEISTNGGHYVALNLAATPYPLGGEAAAVVEDVARLGGFGIAAHPGHPRPELAWSDWTAPIDGIEWINADSEWRDESSVVLARTLAAYLFRPAPALASLFDRPSATLDRWDALSKRRPVVALAAVDAHGGARRGSGAEGESRAAIGPAYEASFRSVSNRVLLERPLDGNASRDAQLVLDAIRRADVYSVVDAISPDVIASVAPSGLALVPAHAADVRRFTDGPRQRFEVVTRDSPGEPPVPWVLTNWAGPPPEREVLPVPPLREAAPLALASEWRVEQAPGSSGRVSGAGPLLTLEYRLQSGEPQSQFVAAAADLQPDQPFAAVAFRGRADRPMRVSVQLRFRPDDRRWVKSVYLGPEERDVMIRVGEMVGAERSGGAPAPSDTPRSILFVVDLVNATPGASGSFTISDLRVSR